MQNSLLGMRSGKQEVTAYGAYWRQHKQEQKKRDSESTELSYQILNACEQGTVFFSVIRLCSK